MFKSQLGVWCHCACRWSSIVDIACSNLSWVCGVTGVWPVVMSTYMNMSIIVISDHVSPLQNTGVQSDEHFQEFQLN